MSKISNTTVYPNILPTANDYVVLTDVEDNNETKTARVQDFQAYFGVSTAEVTLTPTQILNSFTNPVTLIPAQGTNKYIVPFGMAIIRNIGDGVAAYSFGGNIPQLQYDNTFFAEIPFQIFQTSGAYTGYALIGNNITGAANILANRELLFSTPVANPTLGDCRVVISLQYRIVEIA